MKLQRTKKKRARTAGEEQRDGEESDPERGRERERERERQITDNPRRGEQGDENVRRESTWVDVLQKCLANRKTMAPLAQWLERWSYEP